MSRCDPSPPSQIRTVLRRIVLGLIGLILLGGAFLTGAYAHKYRAAIRARLSRLQDSPIVQTNLYNLRIQKLAIAGEGRDGAIDVLGEGVLLVNRRGSAWYVTPERTLQPLAIRVPINRSDFDADSLNARTTDQDRFSVKDLLVQDLGSGIRIVASHFFWHGDKKCHTLRVSALETTREAVLSGQGGAGAWRTILDSECRALNKSADSIHLHVTLGAGGRLAALSPQRILVTSGEFNVPGSAPNGADPAANSSGKTFLIDLSNGSVSEFTRGHRNPQGLAVASDGRIWLTEHGARGGDELNLLVRGGNYGAPELTYGTEYEMMVWPRSKTQGRHDKGIRPVYAWVPSIAPSQLIQLSGRSFPWWSGDLLMSSLESRMLYRIRVEENRVIFVEPFTVGHRIRDIIETPTGTIVLKTDDDFLVYVDNLESAGANLDPVTRGMLVAGNCQSCHSMRADEPSGIGPNLWNVVGRRVASRSDYAYSDALKRLGGNWTAERLRQFVANPGAYAAGTRMQTTTTYTDQQLQDLVAYLSTLR